MKLIISNSSPVPIYEQIKASLIEQIIDGTLEENEPLPSIRNLAQDIRVSLLSKRLTMNSNETVISYPFKVKVLLSPQKM